jgi:predicted transcriptional regulator
VQIRLEEEIKAKLHKYAELINSSESYVVSEALKLLFRKDDEFRIWLEAQPGNNDVPQNGAGPLPEKAKKP